jgi:hypothetical protein
MAHRRSSSLSQSQPVCLAVPCLAAVLAWASCSPAPPEPAPSTASSPTPTPSRAPTLTPRGISDLVFDATVASTCSDHSRDGFLVWKGSGSEFSFWPECYPPYFERYLGEHTLDGRPLPIMGRTCGAFRLLVVFADTLENRALLQKNEHVPQSIKDLVGTGQVEEALLRLTRGFTHQQLFGSYERSGLRVPISYSFDVALTPDEVKRDAFSRHVSGSWQADPWGTLDTSVYEPVGLGLRFPDYDAVVYVHDIPGECAGLRYGRWPKQHPVFHTRDSSYLVELDAEKFAPGLLSHELLDHNVPEYLSQYTLGPYETAPCEHYAGTCETTPVYNPRTGENLTLLLLTMPTGEYIAGYGDIDNDGVVDCIDDHITPTADNVDGDLVPDRFDPDLNANNSPYFWKPAEK